MAWESSRSASFRARHTSADAADAMRVLRSLEHLRIQLEQALPRLPAEITVVLHGRASELVMSNPLMLAGWAACEPTGRRYVTGWAGRREIHMLSPAALRERAAPVTGSREMLRASAAALYAARALAESNPELASRAGPGGGLRTLTRRLRWAWLQEGAARWLAGQSAHSRAAVARRLREGRRPEFPPSPRDAPLLGATVCDLLAGWRGEAAVTRLAVSPGPAGPRAALEHAFDARLDNIDAEWRTHLARFAG